MQNGNKRNGGFRSRGGRPTKDRASLSPEPIAIIGMACRFAGQATTPDAFWKLLCDGTDAIREIPPDRWNIRSFYHPEPGTPGKTYARWGGFIEGIDRFDAHFFGISPREAAQMDPQQRLLLEASYEAIEDGGQRLEVLSQLKTGVFVGISTNDYAQIQSTHEERGSIDTYTTTGGVMSIVANRVSYCFDFKGPSLIVDTACSSSLVATHLACRSIWNGESDLALAGGVNVIICPEPFIGFSRLSMLSPEGRCKAFDASGDGFVRGEGVGVVLLKPLSQAVADGDLIYATIRATAVNQDGRTNGITVPSQQAQSAMLRDACAQAGIAPDKIQFVEAHGTGTLVGDPIEANALGEVLSANRPDGEYCRVGSVKTNIGHLEAGSGIAGLIKTALSLHHGIIPPNLHFNTPNPYIKFDELKLQVQQSLEPWPQNGGGARYAGVNSFGFGGTNAHVLLEGFEGIRPQGHFLPEPSQSGEARGPFILPFSARSNEALKALAGSYVEFLQANHSSISLEELGYNLVNRRTHHDHRLVVVAHDSQELVAHLEAYATGETRVGMHSGQVSSGPLPKLVFVFSGQGPQWWGMGRQLIEQEPVFRDMIQKCDALLRPIAPWSLMEELTKDETHSRMHETAISQPAIFALQVALAALWRSWGIEPDAVIGHSVGEVAAAHLAGIYDLETALRVIFHRGRCMDLATSKGKMIGVAITPEEAEALIRPYGDRVSLAAINSPSSVTVSGESDAIDEITRTLEERQVFFSVLRVQYAFHSAQMDPVRDELLASLEGISPKTATRHLVSTVMGRPTDGSEFIADYWWLNVRQGVKFWPAVASLVEDEYRHFVEVGPHPVLSGYINETLMDRQQRGLVAHSLRREEGERLHMLGTAGALFAAGHPVRWDALYPERRRALRLPRYPWQHQSYWHECETVKATRLGAVPHPLLGHRLKTADPTWRTEVSRTMFPFLDDHRVQGHVVFPAAGYVEMALAAARELFGVGTLIVEDVDFHKALFIPEAEQGPTVQITFYPADSSFSIQGRLSADQNWTLHASGKIRWEPPSQDVAGSDVEQVQLRCPEEVSGEVRYKRFRDNGLEFGPQFQGVDRIWRRYGEAIGAVTQPEPVGDESDSYLYHPAFLDACFHVFSETVDIEADVCLPVHLQQVRYLNQPGSRVWSHAELVHKTEKMLVGNLRFFNQDGTVVMEIRGLTAQSIDTVRDISSETIDNWVYEVQWRLKGRAGAGVPRRQVNFLPPPESLQTQLQSYVEKTSDELGWLRRFREIEPDLNRLCVAHVIDALGQMGWVMNPSDRVTIEGLAERTGIVPQHQRVLRRYLEMLEQDGFLRRIGQEWEVIRTPAAVDTGQLWRSLLRRFPAAYSELNLVNSFGQQLAGLLRGSNNPLHVLFPEGSQVTAEHHYQDSPSFKIYNLLVAKAVSLSLIRLPEGRRVRILEIGAGTAGMTSYVLPVVPPDRTEYVLTDISPLFLHKAESKFQDYAFVSYQALDIEIDPISQGFEPNSFDIILASDVFHATQDLRTTLDHVKRLLAPDGLLSFLEVDIPVRWADLVFGLMEGWWRFTDFDLRPWYALLDRRKWIDLLQEVGFSSPFAVSDTDGIGETGQVVLFARGPSAPETPVVEPSAIASATTGEKQRWLIFADAKGVSDRLAGRLRARGDAAILVRPGEQYNRIDAQHYHVAPQRINDFQRLRQDLAGPIHGVVHAWSLECPSEDASPGSLEIATDLNCHSVLHFVQAWAGQPGEEKDSVGGGGNDDHQGESLRSPAFTSSLSDCPALWLVTSGAQPSGGENNSISVWQSPLIGLGRVIANEFPEFNCKLVDLSPSLTETEVQALVAEMEHSDEENEIVLRGEARYVPRIVRSSIHRSSARAGKQLDPRKELARLEISTPGVLEDLALFEARRTKPGPEEVEIHVRSAALNFRDVLKALGIYPTDGDDFLWLGDECAGVVTAVGEAVTGVAVGDEVMAIAPQSFGTFVITKAAFVARKPDHLSFEEAATIPITFLTAHYALHYLGRMSQGERVLIQAGTGGVGLAAIQLAQLAGAEVFATAGTSEKRSFLKSLGVSHVMDSRSLAFAEQVRDITGGQGVDIVLNSLAGEAIGKGLSCLRSYGRFLEIGKRDIYQNSKIGLRVFKNNLSLSVIDLARVMADRPQLIAEMFSRIARLVEEKQLYPLPYRVFSIREAAGAFRHMAQAKHIGKIIISIPDDPFPVEPLVEGSISFSHEGSYLIVGGTSGLGLSVAEWMVDHGARHLVLMSRSGVTTEEARQLLVRLETRGVNVKVAKGDIGCTADVSRVLSEIDLTMPPLRGVIHSALVLDDGILLQQNQDRFRKVMAPKVNGAWNLHALTAGRPLDCFIMFSSLTSILGNPGQSNYAAANAFLDALAHYRHNRGLPALTVNWGRISDTGYVARHDEISQHVGHFGFKGFAARQATEGLGRLMLNKTVQIGIMHVDWRLWANTVSSRTSPRFSLLVSPEALNQQGGDGGGRIRDVIMAGEPTDRPQLIESYLKEQVGRVLGISPGNLDGERPLNEMGLDSLMSVELKNRIEKEVGVTLPTVELMRGPSIVKLSDVVLRLLTGTDGSAPPDPNIQKGSPRQAPEELLQKLDQLSDQDVDALLDEMVDEDDLLTLLEDDNGSSDNRESASE